MKKFNFFVIFISFVLPFFLIYKAFFTSSPLAWGDAPYFYQENLNELFRKPLIWDFRNTNFGDLQSNVLWLYIPTFLVGLLNHFFGLNSAVLLRLIFYFPATILSIIGAWIFIRSYTNNLWAIFLGVILYGFNTYFLLLIDGGQIGVALAYGMLPFSIFTLKNFGKKQNPKMFVLAALPFLLLTNIDIRFALLSLATYFLISMSEAFIDRDWRIFLKKILTVFPLGFTCLIVDFFWLMPFFKFSKPGTDFVLGNNFSTLLNGLFLFSPHFPKNEFGQIAKVPFYFGMLPVLIFTCFFLNKQKKILSLFFPILFFIFLSKGNADPFGEVYDNFLAKLPLAAAFRDTSKFLAPLLLLCATALSLTVTLLFDKIRQRNLKILGIFLIYIYLLLLVWPALLGNLSGVLAVKTSESDFQKIYQHLQKETVFFRSLWFSEKLPLGFSSEGREAISGATLYKEPPFSSMISGSYDLFYFLHDEQLIDWLRLLGIKYVLFPENERKKTWTAQDIKEKKLFLTLVDGIPGFSKLDWQTSFPVYEVSDTKEKIFSQDKVFLIVGDSSVYKQIKEKVSNFSPQNQGFIFLEDGLLNPQKLFELPKDSLNLIFDKRDQKDLAMAFLQNKFINDTSIKNSKWKNYQPSQYLEAKYELLKNGYESNDLMYGKGFKYSSIPSEKIEYEIVLKKSGDYFLAVRSLSATGSAGLKVMTRSLEKNIKSENRFSWNLIGPIKMSKGNEKVSLENLGGMQAVNILAIFQGDDLQQAKEKAKKLSDLFGSYQLEDEQTRNLFSDLKTHEVNYLEVDPTDYQIEKAEGKWLIFTDHFNANWQLASSEPLPFYSMLNGFLIKSEARQQLKFKPQELQDQASKASLVAASVFIIFGLMVLVKKIR